MSENNYVRNPENTDISFIDAAHSRFQTRTSFYCYQCDDKFDGTTLESISYHFNFTKHIKHYSDCLYCDGKIHTYTFVNDSTLKYYHSCKDSKFLERNNRNGTNNNQNYDRSHTINRNGNTQ